MLIQLVVLLLVAARADFASSSSNFVVLQDPATSIASFVLVDSTSGSIVQNSSLHFAFPFPLLETTVDNERKEISVVAYPKNASGAVLYVLDANLTVTQTLVQTALDFFDLQHSADRHTFFGIAVNGTYGRVLSDFTFDFAASSVHARPLAALPYMWYVNASSYDQKRNIYFGLLNNFPRQPNSTSAQKLAVGNYSHGLPPFTAFVDLFTSSGPTAAIIHFVAWSASAQQLLGLAQYDATTVALVTIDPTSGHYAVVGIARGYTVGPIAADSDDLALYAWLQSVGTTGSGRVYGRWHLSNGEFEVILAHPNDPVYVAAATHTEW